MSGLSGLDWDDDGSAELDLPSPVHRSPAVQASSPLHRSADAQASSPLQRSIQRSMHQSPGSPSESMARRAEGQDVPTDITDKLGRANFMLFSRGLHANKEQEEVDPIKYKKGLSGRQALKELEQQLDQDWKVTDFLKEYFVHNYPKMTMGFAEQERIKYLIYLLDPGFRPVSTRVYTTESLLNLLEFHIKRMLADQRRVGIEEVSFTQDMGAASRFRHHSDNVLKILNKTLASEKSNIKTIKRLSDKIVDLEQQNNDLSRILDRTEVSFTEVSERQASGLLSESEFVKKLKRDCATNRALSSSLVEELDSEYSSLELLQEELNESRKKLVETEEKCMQEIVALSQQVERAKSLETSLVNAVVQAIKAPPKETFDWKAATRTSVDAWIKDIGEELGAKQEQINKTLEASKEKDKELTLLSDHLIKQCEISKELKEKINLVKEITAINEEELVQHERQLNESQRSISQAHEKSMTQSGASGISNQYDIGTDVNMQVYQQGTPQPYAQSVAVQSDVPEGRLNVSRSPVRVQQVSEFQFPEPLMSGYPAGVQGDVTVLDDGGSADGEPGLNKSVLLTSPSGEKAVVLNIDVEPQPLVSTADGGPEHFLCSVNLNVTPTSSPTRAMTPPRFQPATPRGHSTPGSAARGRLDLRRQLFTPGRRPASRGPVLEEELVALDDSMGLLNDSVRIVYEDDVQPFYGAFSPLKIKTEPGDVPRMSAMDAMSPFRIKSEPVSRLDESMGILGDDAFDDDSFGIYQSGRQSDIQEVIVRAAQALEAAYDAGLENPLTENLERSFEENTVPNTAVVQALEELVEPSPPPPPPPQSPVRSKLKFAGRGRSMLPPGSGRFLPPPGRVQPPPQAAAYADPGPPKQQMVLSGKKTLTRPGTTNVQARSLGFGRGAFRGPQKPAAAKGVATDRTSLPMTSNQAATTSIRTGMVQPSGSRASYGMRAPTYQRAATTQRAPISQRAPMTQRAPTTQAGTSTMRPTFQRRLR